MTLSEYINSEFGIVPDEVQLETIRELSINKTPKHKIDEIHSSLEGFRSSINNWFVEANREAFNKQKNIEKYFK